MSFSKNNRNLFSILIHAFYTNHSLTTSHSSFFYLFWLLHHNWVSQMWREHSLHFYSSLQILFLTKLLIFLGRVNAENATVSTPSSPTSRLLLEYEMHLRNTLARGMDAESYSLHTFEALLTQSMENLGKYHLVVKHS